MANFSREKLAKLEAASSTCLRIWEPVPIRKGKTGLTQKIVCGGGGETKQFGKVQEYFNMVVPTC